MGTLHCPGLYWTGIGEAAWLSLLSGRSLPTSHLHGDLHGLRRNGLGDLRSAYTATDSVSVHKPLSAQRLP